MKWYLIVVFICIFLANNEVEHLLTCNWLSVQLLHLRKFLFKSLALPSFMKDNFVRDTILYLQLILAHSLLFFPSGFPWCYWGISCHFLLYNFFFFLIALKILSLFLMFNNSIVICLTLVQSLSCVWLFATLWTAARQASLSITNSQSLLKLMSIELVMPSNHLFSAIPFSTCFQSFPLSGSFLMSQFFISVGQSIGASALASVFPVNIQDWSPLGLTGLISLQSKGLSRIFSNTTVQKDQLFGAQLSLWSKFHIHIWLLGKNIALTRWTFLDKVIPLLFNIQRHIKERHMTNV